VPPSHQPERKNALLGVEDKAAVGIGQSLRGGLGGANNVPSSCLICGATLRTRCPSVLDSETREEFSILACPDCGLGYTSPQPRDLSPYYAAAYYGARHGFTANHCMQRRLRWVHSLLGSGWERKLLDVGCGDGGFLLAAQQQGWRGAGTERHGEVARNCGLQIFPNVRSASAWGPYDCITLWHSLEHVPDPRATLEACRTALSPEGNLLVAVPDAEGLQARAFGSRWFHLDVPRHLHHFTSRSLTKLLCATGFSPVREWHQEFEYDLLGWSQSALNALRMPPNLFFRALTGHAARAQRLSLVFSWIYGVGFSALALPLVPFGSLLRRGGTLILAARPE